MNVSYLLSSVLNWMLGLLGMLALITGLSFLPALFGFETPSNVWMMMGEVTLSKGILELFSYTFGIGVLVVSTALFVWISLLFSMSFHAIVESLICLVLKEREEALVAAWVSVLVANFFMVSLFIYILFGTILTPATLLIGSLMLVAMGALLAANYRETYQI